MVNKYLTKKQAEDLFKSEVDYKNLTTTDQGVYWNDFVDHLHKDGQISDNQRNNWGSPCFHRKKIQKSLRIQVHAVM